MKLPLLQYTTQRRSSITVTTTTILLLLLVITASIHDLSAVNAGTSNHRYKKGEHVELWVNKVKNVKLLVYLVEHVYCIMCIEDLIHFFLFLFPSHPYFLTSLSRSVRMQIHRKPTNIIHSPIVLQIRNTIPRRKTQRIDSMRTPSNRLVNTCRDILYDIRDTILHLTL